MYADAFGQRDGSLRPRAYRPPPDRLHAQVSLFVECQVDPPGAPSCLHWVGDTTSHNTDHWTSRDDGLCRTSNPNPLAFARQPSLSSAGLRARGAVCPSLRRQAPSGALGASMQNDSSENKVMICGKYGLAHETSCALHSHGLMDKIARSRRCRSWQLLMLLLRRHHRRSPTTRWQALPLPTLPFTRNRSCSMSCVPFCFFLFRAETLTHWLCCGRSPTASWRKWSPGSSRMRGGMRHFSGP